MTQPRGANPHANDPPPRGANISGIVVTRVPARLQVTTAPATAVITLAQIMDAPNQLVSIVAGSRLDFGLDQFGLPVVYQVTGWTDGPPPGLVVTLIPQTPGGTP